MSARFDPPPGWPVPTGEWVPEEDWVPDPSWPLPPPNWQFWTDTDNAATSSAPTSATYGTNLTSLTGGLMEQASGSDPGTRSAILLLAFALVIVGAVVSGISGMLITAGLVVGGVALVGLVTGRVRWAGVTSRRRAGVAAALAVSALAFGGNAAGVPGPDVPVAPGRTGIVEPPTETSEAPATSTSASHTSASSTSPQKSTVTPTRAPSPRLTATASAKAKTPTRSVAVPKVVSRPKPTTSTRSYVSGVTPGAFCSQHWAYGQTSKGTLMQCKTTATDDRFRWRRA